MARRGHLGKLVELHDRRLRLGVGVAEGHDHATDEQRHHGGTEKHGVAGVIAHTAVEAARERTGESAVGAPAVGGRAAEAEQGKSEVELGADSDHRVVIS